MDFITETGAYSVEVFNQAGPDSEESFKSGTESFMEKYIPNKCGSDSFDPVSGEFTIVSDNMSYDFVTNGVSLNGQKTCFKSAILRMIDHKNAVYITIITN